MTAVGLVGGLGPVELGIVLLVFATVGVLWLLVLGSRTDGEVDPTWVVGIGVLFLMGVLPGLVGLWLYLSTRADDGEDVTGTSPSGASLSLGLVIFFGCAFAGSIAASMVVELGWAGETGWVPLGAFAGGAVLAFMAISFVLYGR